MYQGTQQYEDLSELKTNPQLLQVRLKGDADEISQFIQALRKEHDSAGGSIINNVRKERECMVISLSKRMYAKQLLGLLYDGGFTKIKIIKARRLSKPPLNKMKGCGNNENDASDDVVIEEEEEQQKLPQEMLLTKKSNNNNNKSNSKHKEDDQQLLTLKRQTQTLLREILKNNYNQKQLVDYAINYPCEEISLIYMDLITTPPYCQQIEMALETVSKIQKLSPTTNISNHQKNSSSIVRQLKPSFKTEDTDEEEGGFGNENKNKNKNENENENENNDINPDTTRPINLFSNQKKVMNNNNHRPPSPYSSQESNKMVFDHKFSNFPNIGRTQDSVQKNVALKQNASKSQQQQYFFRSSKTGESDNNVEEQQQIQISSPLTSFNQSTPHKKQTKSNN